MKSKIIQQFKSTINGVEIFDKVTFYTCDWILGLIEDKFDMELPTEFVADFVHIVQKVYDDEGVGCIEDFENDLFTCVEEDVEEGADITTLELMSAQYNIGYGYFDALNRKIKDWNNCYKK